MASFQALATSDQPGVERGAQPRDDVRQRVAEILVFALAEAVALHHHAAAEMARVGIQAGDGFAFLCVQQLRKHGAAMAVQRGRRVIRAGPASSGSGNKEGVSETRGMGQSVGRWRLHQQPSG
jgi:hypothetical protein